MIGIAELETIIRLALYTGYLKDEVPASLLVVSEVESGKSELAKKFADNDGVAFPHDITAYGIVKTYGSRLLPNPGGGARIRHLIFPEFIHCLERQRETVKTLLAFLNGLVAEGIREIHTYKTSFKFHEPMSAGAICCLTVAELADWKLYWQRSGFLSRFLPLTYSYSQPVEDRIFESIFARDYRNEPAVSLAFPSGPQEVHFPPALARRLKSSAKNIATACAQLFVPPAKMRGFRGQVALQRLAMGSALMNGRDVVQEGDVDLVISLAEKYMNYQYTEI